MSSSDEKLNRLCLLKLECETRLEVVLLGVVGLGYAKVLTCIGEGEADRRYTTRIEDVNGGRN